MDLWIPPTERDDLTYARPIPKYKSLYKKPRISAEELFHKVLSKRKYLSLKVQFLVEDEDKNWKVLRGRAIRIRKIPSAGMLWQILKNIGESLQYFNTSKGKE